MCMSMCICVLIMCDRALSFDFEKKIKKILVLDKSYSLSLLLLHVHQDRTSQYMRTKDWPVHSHQGKTGQYMRTKTRLAHLCAQCSSSFFTVEPKSVPKLPAFCFPKGLSASLCSVGKQFFDICYYYCWLLSSASLCFWGCSLSPCSLHAFDACWIVLIFPSSTKRVQDL